MNAVTHRNHVLMLVVIICDLRGTLASSHEVQVSRSFALGELALDFAAGWGQRSLKLEVPQFQADLALGKRDSVKVRRAAGLEIDQSAGICAIAWRRHV